MTYASNKDKGGMNEKGRKTVEYFVERIKSGEKSEEFGVSLEKSFPIENIFNVLDPVEYKKIQKSDPIPREEYNACQLRLPDGTIYLVIGGVAYGFTNYDDTYRRVLPNPHCTGGNSTGELHVCIPQKRIEVPNVNWIETSIMDPNADIRHGPDNRTVYLFRSGVRHGISSAAAFWNYQFDWDSVNDRPSMSQQQFDTFKNGVVLSETTRKQGVLLGTATN